jgi:CDP-diacylglycerol---glycerol-3-phosphate 3-phosphatidyltransferase
MIDWDAAAGLALPLGVGSLLGIAALGGPPPESARVAREGGTAFLSEGAMHRGYVWVERLAALFVRGGISADGVSWISLGLGAAAGLLVGAGWIGCAAWALAASGLCDGIDGAVARQTNRSTKGGAVLDSALDRYVEFFFFAGLLVYFAGHWPQQLLVMVTLFGGFMVTYSTAKAEALQITPPRGWMKRSERLVWLTGGSALAAAIRLAHLRSAPLLLAVLVVIAVFANASAIRRLRALRHAADSPRS